MTIKVNRVPQFLMQVLRLQSADKSEPGELSRVIAGVMDVSPYYLTDQESVVVGAAVNLAATGDFGTAFTVPANELWVPRWLTLQIDCSSAPYQGLVSWSLIRSGVNVYLPFRPNSLGSNQLAAANAQYEDTWQPQPGFILRPGDSVLVESSQNAAGAVIARVTGMVARIVI